jgi:hypothetical protein
MKILSYILFFGSILFLSSCGVNYAMVLNHNQNVSQVQLGSNNFKMSERVTGTAEIKYIVLIGGLKKKQLYGQAYAEMLTKANLGSGSKAIVNVLTEEHAAFVTPFFIKRTVNVSANVVEFTK